MDSLYLLVPTAHAHAHDVDTLRSTWDAWKRGDVGREPSPEILRSHLVRRLHDDDAEITRSAPLPEASWGCPKSMRTP